MKSMMAALAVGIISTACGGGGSEPPTTSTQSAPPPCRQTVTVQVYGDSTQNQAWHDGYLQQILAARFGDRVTVIDQAASGTTSQALLYGQDGVNPPWPENVTGDVVVVNHGINDAARGTPLDTFRATMLHFAAVPGAVLETPNPVNHPPIDDSPYAQATRSAAKAGRIPLADVQAYVMSLPNWRALMQPDGVHPSMELQQMIAENVMAPTLAPIIDSRLCR